MDKRKSTEGQTTIYKILNRKLRTTRTLLKPMVKSGAPEWQAVPPLHCGPSRVTLIINPVISHNLVMTSTL
jgi:hypothetical protein